MYWRHKNFTTIVNLSWVRVYIIVIWRHSNLTTICCLTFVLVFSTCIISSFELTWVVFHWLVVTHLTRLIICGGEYVVQELTSKLLVLGDYFDIFKFLFQNTKGFDYLTRSRNMHVTTDTQRRTKMKIAISILNIITCGDDSSGVTTYQASFN